MKMTFSKNVPDVPVGKYTARFDGVTLKEASGKLDEKGRPMPPAMTWDFTITEGEHQGKRVDRLTSRTPTPKSGCGKMLAGIADDILKDGAEIDLGQYVGKLYRIAVEENGDRTRLSDNPAPVRVYDQAGRAAPPPAPKSGPPKPKAAEPGDGSAWMMHDEAAGDYVDKTGAEVRAYMLARKVTANDVFVYPADGRENPEPKAAAEFGFKDPLPF